MKMLMELASLSGYPDFWISGSLDQFACAVEQSDDELPTSAAVELELYEVYAGITDRGTPFCVLLQT